MQRALLSLLLFAFFVFPAGCESDGAKKEPESPPEATRSSVQFEPLSPQARRGDTVYQYVDAMRADLSDGKTQLINEIMKLSRDESEKFWPIYHDYEDELFALGDRRVEAARQFVKAQVAESFDNAQAAKLADQWFDFESRRLELLRKYHDQIASELSGERAAQFLQIEHRVGTVTDLMLASELPLIRPKSPPAR